MADLVGRRVKKEFGGHGWFVGRIIHCKPSLLVAGDEDVFTVECVLLPLLLGAQFNDVARKNT